jgi:anti-sigma regulatory factor (Ser/Thr protein kinase)
MIQVVLERVEHRLELVPDPSASGAARAWLRRLLPPGHAAEDACLVISELIANSLRHAWFAPDDRLLLLMVVGSDSVRVEVSDPGPGFLPGQPPVPLPNVSRGRGLYLVQQLARRWGTEGDRPMRVWAELPL